jgi:PST family polysaccharide transporter
VILSYLWHPYRPRFSLAAHSELFHFSKWLALNNALHVLRERTADFVIGRLLGAGPLGLYSLGYEVSNLPTSELVLPINRATIPGYSLLVGDVARLRAGFLSVIGMIALLVIPAGMGIAATAPLATAVLLGDKWLDAVPLIEILAFYGVLTALQANCMPIYVATGRPDLQTRLNAVYLLILVPLMILLTREGLEGAATACVITAAVILPINFTVVLRSVQGSWRQIVRVMWRPIVGAGVMSVVVRSWLAANDDAEHVLHQLGLLVATVVLGAVVYFATVLLLWWLAGRPDGAERFALERASTALRGIRAGLARAARMWTT